MVVHQLHGDVLAGLAAAGGHLAVVLPVSGCRVGEEGGGGGMGNPCGGDDARPFSWEESNVSEICSLNCVTPLRMGFDLRLWSRANHHQFSSIHSLIFYID